MKHLARLGLLLACQLALVVPAAAADFKWMRDLSVRADADPAGFRASLATRFRLGDLEIDTVIRKAGDYANAYMVLRLSEMSGRSPHYVVDRYHHQRGQGWGVVAKNLGIKPGSREFHALKRGHDLYAMDSSHAGDMKGKGKGKGKPPGHKKPKHKHYK